MQSTEGRNVMHYACVGCVFVFFFFSSRRRHTRLQGDWSSDVCSSDLPSRSRFLVRGFSMKYESVGQFLEEVAQRNPGQPEFLQAVTEVMESLWPFIEKNPKYAEHGLLERLVEPERSEERRVGKECRSRWW